MGSGDIKAPIKSVIKLQGLNLKKRTIPKIVIIFITTRTIIFVSRNIIKYDERYTNKVGYSKYESENSIFLIFIFAPPVVL